jgi:hypothetical protein
MPKNGTAVIVVAAAILAACSDAGPNPIDTASTLYPCTDTQTGLSRPCRALWLEPATGAPGSIVLVGDSLPVRALSDSGFMVANWSVEGPLGTTAIAPTPAMIWSKALAAGNSIVTANTAGGRRASTTITAVDSAAITALTGPTNVTATVRAGTTFIAVALRDASGREVVAVPQWSASNNALVSISPQSYSSYGFFMPGAYVTLHGTGSVTLTVTFRSLTRQIPVFITP